jgi:hypothetical protein
MGDGETEYMTDRSSAIQSDEAGCVDPEVVADLRAFEENTVARYGTVLDTIVADYDDGATAESVRASVVASIEAATGDPEKRLVSSSEAVVSGSHSGRQIFVLVELVDGHVFVDRIAVPPEPELVDGRYAALTEAYGGVELLPQLSGEPVPITHTETKWRIDLETPADAESTERIRSHPAIRAGLSIAALGLVGLSAILLQDVSATPVVGSFSPQSILLSTLAVLTAVTVVNAATTLSMGGEAE